MYPIEQRAMSVEVIDKVNNVGIVALLIIDNL